MGDHAIGDHGIGYGPDAFRWAIFESFIVIVLIGAVIGYAGALWVSRGRSPWPTYRTAMWYLGAACAGAGLIGPVAAAAHTSFVTHMVGHLLLGMIAPLLLALAAPITLVLRALPVAMARVLSGLLRTRYVRVVTHPVVAAVLNVGGLWVLYITELYHLMHDSVVLHAVVHAHIFLAGYLFTASLIRVDPDPHRASFRIRSVVLIVFIAAHSILAKWLYAHPPAGIEAADARAGAQVMYYGGDVVDITIIVLLFAGWYTATRPRDHGPDCPPPGHLSPTSPPSWS